MWNSILLMMERADTAFDLAGLRRLGGGAAEIPPVLQNKSFMNTTGHIFRLTSFGESHGAAIGGVIDGMPAGVGIDVAIVQKELNRRRPGQSVASTLREESDQVEILSGLFGGVTTGMPIGFIVRNEDSRPQDYSGMKDLFRPSHADFTYFKKYGLRDFRGGGRQSARETVARVVAGAFAKAALANLGIGVRAYTSRIGSAALEGGYRFCAEEEVEANIVRCPDAEAAGRMETVVREALGKGDTVGGIVTCVARGCPAGLGSPVFGKLHSELAAAMMSINAAKGFEVGDGFAAAEMLGSECNDPFMPDGKGGIITAANHSGGVQGGVSNGMDITFRVAFKPVPTLKTAQRTVDVHGNAAVVRADGRHDPCVVPRAVPVVEAMAAMVLLDHCLLQRADRI